MLQESDSGSSTEYGELTQTVSPVVLRTIAEFLGVAMPVNVTELRRLVVATALHGSALTSPE